MFQDPKQTPTLSPNPHELWDDIVSTRRSIEELLKQGEQSGDLRPVQAALDGLKLKTANFEKLVEEMQAPLRAVLGKYFLGAEAWHRGFGMKVGPPALIPQYITPELLNSDCPLHPGQTIKETHILMLIPRAVDGEPYSALKLYDLCVRKINELVQARAKFSKYSLVNDVDLVWRGWQTRDWAKASPSISEWVLIPKSDPDPAKVPQDRHFRGKSIVQHGEVHAHYAENYRQATAIEIMTAALLNEVVNGGPTMLASGARHSNYLHCADPSLPGDLVLVGGFDYSGLEVRLSKRHLAAHEIGRALARKS